MISEAHLVIVNAIEKSQKANSEYATQLVGFGREFIRKARDRKVAAERAENLVEGGITYLLRGNMRSVQRRIRETEMKDGVGILTPLDHDTLYSVIRGILQERGW